MSSRTLPLGLVMPLGRVAMAPRAPRLVLPVCLIPSHPFLCGFLGEALCWLPLPVAPASFSPGVGLASEGLASKEASLPLLLSYSEGSTKVSSHTSLGMTLGSFVPPSDWGPTPPQVMTPQGCGGFPNHSPHQAQFCYPS